MFKIFSEYFKYMHENVYNKLWMYIVYGIFPTIVTAIIFLCFGVSEVDAFLKNSSQELINVFALTAGFLFTGVALIISKDLEVSEERIKKISKEKNISIPELKDKIKNLRQTLLYDIVFQFTLTIGTILSIAIIKSISIKLIVVSLSILIIFSSVIILWSILRLLNNFLFFQKIIFGDD